MSCFPENRITPGNQRRIIKKTGKRSFIFLRSFVAGVFWLPSLPGNPEIVESMLQLQALGMTTIYVMKDKGAERRPLRYTAERWNERNPELVGACFNCKFWE